MKIKFSHNYKKIAGTTEARLLEVINVNLQNLSHYFITYDTDNMYILPRKGDYNAHISKDKLIVNEY